jgi:hypothetical protein
VAASATGTGLAAAGGAVVTVVAAVVVLGLCIFLAQGRRKGFFSRRAKELRLNPPTFEVVAASGSGGDQAGLKKKKKSKGPPPTLTALPKGWKDYTGDASLGSRAVVVEPFSAANQFNRIPVNSADVSELPAPYEELAHINRYRNILPNAHSRVQLAELDGDPLSSYINANWIKSFDGSPMGYIASQGPLPTTLEPFWRMAWENKTKAVVMVTGLVEGGRPKCARYWPEATYDPATGTGAELYGAFQVAAISSTRRGAFVQTILNVSVATAAGDREERIIHHFWYDTWPVKPMYPPPPRPPPLVDLSLSC